MLKKILYVLDPKQKRQVVLLFFMILLNTLFELLGVSAVLPLITAVTEPETINDDRFLSLVSRLLGEPEPSRLVVILSLMMVVIYIIKNCFILVMTKYLFHFIYQNQRVLAVRLMKSYMRQEYAFHTIHNMSELQRNIVNDVNCFFSALQYMLEFAIEILVCCTLVVYLAVVDIATTLVIAVIMSLLMLVFLKVFRKRMKEYGKRARELSEKKTRWFLQSFGGIKEIKTMDCEDYFINEYEGTYREHATVFEKQIFLGNMTKPVVEMFAISTILVFMSVRIMSGADLNSFIPVLSVFAVAAFRLLPSFNRLSGYIASLIFNLPAVNAVYGEIKEIEELNSREKNRNKDPQTAIGLEKEISVKNVSFSYPSKPDKKVLSDISFDIPAKRSVALVGSSGSGKTTVADLILGLYEPQSGTICADGININEHVRSWHECIAYIPQSIYLTDDTIRANVAFGIPDEEIDDKKVWAALEEASLADFVRSQPEGINSNIGDRGVKISGGQRQRIGIARAIYRDPRLLILDEATSALDTETETAVMDAIYGLSGKVTMLIIAHRLSTIKCCDMIYRIKDGKAEAISYEEACSAEAQLAGEEKTE